MKFLGIILLIFSNFCFAQGKFSYEFSSMLQKKFVTEKDLPELKNYRYEQGKILGEISENAPYFSTIEIFRKGSVAVVVLEKMIDPKTKTKSVIEVLKLSKILKNQEIRISGCSRKNPYPEEEIIAVVSANSSKTKVIQAYVLKDIRFENLDVKKVKCRNEL